MINIYASEKTPLYYKIFMHSSKLTRGQAAITRACEFMDSPAAGFIGCVGQMTTKGPVCSLKAQCFPHFHRNPCPL